MRAIDTEGESPSYVTFNMPTPNFKLQVGESLSCVTFEFREGYTIKKRLKWWLFCKLFPFKIVHWDKLEKTEDFPNQYYGGAYG